MLKRQCWDHQTRLHADKTALGTSKWSTAHTRLKIKQAEAYTTFSQITTLRTTAKLLLKRVSEQKPISKEALSSLSHTQASFDFPVQLLCFSMFSNTTVKLRIDKLNKMVNS